jgi:hypothetical protein
MRSFRSDVVDHVHCNQTIVRGAMMKTAHPELGSTVLCSLKIAIAGVVPKVWRRVLVPSTATLADLHEIIQGIFDWDESHLHVFCVNNREYMHPEALEVIDDFPHAADAAKVLLAGILARGIKTFEYEYDFGDSWCHDIKIEKVLEPVPGQKYPEVIAGEGAGPIEDCGGFPGYNDLIRIWKNGPRNPGEEDIMEWAGPNFNPTAFDLKACNRRLAKYHKPRVVVRATATNREAKKSVKKAAKDPKE